ncbi:2OG-Fe(II) oxygenase [Coralloluteibacterium thermophilus]
MPRPLLDARWRQAVDALVGGDADAALIALDALARAGHAPAQCDLGRALCYGVGREADVAAGLQWLLRADAAGEPRAAFSLAVIGLAGIWIARDAGTAARRLRHAAQAGFPPALRGLALALRAEDAADAQRISDICLAHAAARGDPVSARLRARPAFRMDALSPLPLLPEPDLSRGLAPPPARRTLCTDPRVEVADQALTAAECDLAIALGTPFLRPSATVDPRTGAAVKVPLRTSHDAVFDPVVEDVTLVAMQARMAAFADKPLGCAEPLALLRYGPGQEYRPHRDYLPPSRVRPVPEGGAGQRDRTVIAYLATPEAGGETAFPDLALRVPARRGDLLRFDNLDAAGRPAPRSLHAGLPVARGEKWICTLWFREAAYRGA